jgi:hypothetical protein
LSCTNRSATVRFRVFRYVIPHAYALDAHGTLLAIPVTMNDNANRYEAIARTVAALSFSRDETTWDATINARFPAGISDPMRAAIKSDARMFRGTL